MIVDDEEAIRCVGAVILEANGFAPITAASGVEALSKLQNGTDVSLILLDFRMPGMDGAETFRQLRQKWPMIPIIIASDHNPRELSLKFNGERPEGFLHKPFTFASIGTAVHRALDPTGAHFAN